MKCPTWIQIDLSIHQHRVSPSSADGQPRTMVVSMLFGGFWSLLDQQMVVFYDQDFIYQPTTYGNTIIYPCRIPSFKPIFLLNCIIFLTYKVSIQLVHEALIFVDPPPCPYPPRVFAPPYLSLSTPSVHPSFPSCVFYYSLQGHFLTLTSHRSFLDSWHLSDNHSN